MSNTALELQLECAKKTGYPVEAVNDPSLIANIRIAGHVGKAYADCVKRSVNLLPETSKPSSSAPQEDSKKLFGKPVPNMVFYGVIGLGIVVGGYLLWKMIKK